MERKLLVICGPTATGKTSLALHLAKVFNGEVVSADSRQVYKWLNIGTGKDLPVNSKFQITNDKLGKQGIGFYKVDGVKIWGYDLVEATEEFSVAQYVTIARKIIEDIWERGKFPILVGGAGLYIKGVVDGIPTASVPRNLKLRENLEGKRPDELFEILAQIDSVKAASLNISDRKNPRRLIRAIEVGQFKIKNPTVLMNRFIGTKNSPLFIGATARKNYLDKKIEGRVEKRVKQGIEEEVKNLLARGVNWNHQSMQALGYKQWRYYIEGTRTREQVIDQWKKQEKNYANRQIVWFKKNKRINWFDITKPSWQDGVEKLVKKWYSS